MTPTPDPLREALQAVWDLGDKLDSNHTRWAALQVAEGRGIEIDAHNRFSAPPRNCNDEQKSALQAELDDCWAALTQPSPQMERLAKVFADHEANGCCDSKTVDHLWQSVKAKEMP